MAKNAHNAKAIAYAKYFVWVKLGSIFLGQKLKLPKTYEKPLYKHITVPLCKKRLQKTVNIRKMRAFRK